MPSHCPFHARSQPFLDLSLSSHCPSLTFHRPFSAVSRAFLPTRAVSIKKTPTPPPPFSHSALYLGTRSLKKVCSQTAPPPLPSAPSSHSAPRAQENTAVHHHPEVVRAEFVEGSPQ